MNWFDILKNSELVQSQRQGMKPIDIQKPFKRVKEDKDSTCRDKLIKLYQKAVNSFPDGKRTDEDRRNKDYDLSMLHKFEYEGGIVEVNLTIPNEGVLPDDVYCRLLNGFEKVEKLGPGNSDFVDYQYIDYNLKEPKLVLGDSEIYYENNERFGASTLALNTYINDSPDLHPGQSIYFSVEYVSKRKTIEEGVSAYTGSPILRHKTLKDFKNWRGLF